MLTARTPDAVTPRGLVADATDMLEPFLARTGEGYVNPLTGRALGPADGPYPLVDGLHRGTLALAAVGETRRPALRRDGWLIPRGGGWDRRSRLVFVSLESDSRCNQSCVFCPVSVAPRPRRRMPADLYGSVAGQLAAYRDTLQAVFMNIFNEPTIDPGFLERVRTLREHGLPPALNTNASGLTPPLVDRLLDLGGLAYLSVNLSTLDRARYREQRGGDLLPRVLANLDYAGARPLAPRMVIAVLGREDAAHERERDAVAERFRDTRFAVEAFPVMDRARWLDFGRAPARPHAHLRGCEQTGSRPLEHLHVGASGRCVLCCQDFGERHGVGDLARQSVAEVLAGDELARYRRWVYGYEAAAEAFLCRGCVFARTP